MNTERNYVVGGIIVLIILVGGVYFFSKDKTTSTGTENATSTNSTGTSTDATGGMILPYGKATVGIGQTVRFRGISITPLSVVEDSRCPANVQCIQAGTVRVNVRSTLASGATRQDVIKLNTASTVDTFSVNLTAVEPGTKAGSKVADKDYKLTFEVRQSAVVDTELIGK